MATIRLPIKGISLCRFDFIFIFTQKRNRLVITASGADLNTVDKRAAGVCVWCDLCNGWSGSGLAFPHRINSPFCPYQGIHKIKRNGPAGFTGPFLLDSIILAEIVFTYNPTSHEFFSSITVKKIFYLLWYSITAICERKRQYQKGPSYAVPHGENRNFSKKTLCGMLYLYLGQILPGQSLPPTGQRARGDLSTS